jgi:hypothetical protein
VGPGSAGDAHSLGDAKADRSATGQRRSCQEPKQSHEARSGPAGDWSSAWKNGKLLRRRVLRRLIVAQDQHEPCDTRRTIVENHGPRHSLLATDYSIMQSLNELLDITLLPCARERYLPLFHLMCKPLLRTPS